MTTATMPVSVADLEKLHRELKTEADTLAEKAKVEAEAAAHIEATIAILNQAISAPTPIRVNRPVASYKGMSQKDAIVKMAEAAGGEIAVRDIKKLFIESGLTRGSKHLTPQLYKVMRKAGRFQRVSPGVYRLTPTLANASNF